MTLEVAAFQDWVVNQGGGVITLTGYSGNGQEINAPNQLLAFSGISYNNDGIGAPYSWPVSGCAGSNPIADWIKTDPVIANLSNNVTWIGLDNGRSINSPADDHLRNCPWASCRERACGQARGQRSRARLR